MRSTRVDLESIGLTEHGQRYRVTYAGDTLVEVAEIRSSTHAVLLLREVTGRLQVWHRGQSSADMQLDIDSGAGLALKETASESLRIVTWEPWRPRPDDSTRGAFPIAGRGVRRQRPPGT
jgi:hypothetical protein